MRSTFRNLKTNIKCILRCKLNFGFGNHHNAVALIRFIFFLRKPLPALASLKRLWFRADLTFRDPCAKYFLHLIYSFSWHIPHIFSRSFTLWFSPWIHGENETDVRRYIPRCNQFANFERIRVSQDKTLLVKLVFPAKQSRSWLLYVYCFLDSNHALKSRIINFLFFCFPK